MCTDGRQDTIGILFILDGCCSFDSLARPTDPQFSVSSKGHAFPLI